MSEESRKKRQRLLQLAMGVLLILVVILVEMVAVTPTGIYSHTKTGFQKFKIGDDRSKVLKEINRIKAVRTLETCDPAGRIVLETRRRFDMTADLAVARIWRYTDRKKGLYLFWFSQDLLARIIYLNDLPGDDDPFALFTECFSQNINQVKDQIEDRVPEQDLDFFLKTQTRYQVFYH